MEVFVAVELEPWNTALAVGCISRELEGCHNEASEYVDRIIMPSFNIVLLAPA
jgi:hypothetical protein